MESQRNLLLIGLLFVSFLIYQQWGKDHSPKPVDTEQTTTQTQSDDQAKLPQAPGEANVTPADDARTHGQLITVQSDVLKLTIDTRGGDIVEADLLKYAKTEKNKDPVQLLNINGSHKYTARSGLIGDNGLNKGQRPVYSVDKKAFKLTDGQKQVTVPLTYTGQNGVVYHKLITLDKGSYDVKVDYKVTNNEKNTIAVQQFAELKQTTKKAKGGFFGHPNYRGGAYSSDDTRYEKYTFDDIKDKPLNITTKGGWVAMLQHYFAAAWVPSQNQESTLYSRYQDGFAHIGFISAKKEIAPGQTGQIKSSIWIGPELQDKMAAVAPHLDLTVDYGWLWFISQPLFKFLKFLHSLVGNWGVAIILITLIVKGLMYPLTRAQYTSMAKMRILQPKMKELRERYADDRQKQSQAMMELYKKEKVNPLGGCFPIALQMPIFIALYWAFLGSVELRHAPFFLWINDLSAQDPYYILPILMGISMFMIQKMSPTAVADPMQQKIMQFMPVAFTVFFLFFPAGLVLYWLVSNCVTLIQQTLIYRELEKKGLHSRDKKDKKK